MEKEKRESQLLWVRNHSTVHSLSKAPFTHVRRFLSRNSMQFLSRSELHRVSDIFETSAISRRQNRRRVTRAIFKLRLRAQQKLYRDASTSFPGLFSKKPWRAFLKSPENYSGLKTSRGSFRAHFSGFEQRFSKHPIFA